MAFITGNWPIPVPPFGTDLAGLLKRIFAIDRPRVGALSADSRLLCNVTEINDYQPEAAAALQKHVCDIEGLLKRA
jgi:hypothetical protein